MTALHYLAITLAVLAVLFLFASFSCLRDRKYGQVGTHLALFLSFILFAGIFSLGALSVRGYQALTYEQLAASVTVEPVAEDKFKATFVFADGPPKTFMLAGNQLLVDAHIVKWKPIFNILGMHTNYELARVSGRYFDLQDEQTKPHTVYAFSEAKLIDIFELHRKYPIFKFLVDAEYGSASFVPAKSKQQYVLNISTSGLLFRQVQ